MMYEFMIVDHMHLLSAFESSTKVFSHNFIDFHSSAYIANSVSDGNITILFKHA